METYSSLDELLAKKPEIEIGISMGSFDGVHLGHQALLNNLIEKCKDKNLKSVVITFSPHPREILGGDDEFLMFGEESRKKFIEDLGIDFLVTYRFNRDFSTLSAEDFIKNFLIVSSRVKALHVGHDFSFGANKEGSSSYMREFLKKNKELDVSFSTESEFKKEGVLVSSSLIRNFIKEGKVDEARCFLGKPFYVEGIVAKGDGRGKELGFPTANIVLSDKYVLPEKGVYITRVRYGDMPYHSVTNVGVKPTFEDDEISVTVESHLFDFDKDIYGEKIQVEFFKKIREEIKFNSVNDLIAQIKKDKKNSKAFWSEKSKAAK